MSVDVGSLVYVPCPTCKDKIRVPNLLDQQVRCPRCGTMLRIAHSEPPKADEEVAERDDRMVQSLAEIALDSRQPLPVAPRHGTLEGIAALIEILGLLCLVASPITLVGLAVSRVEGPAAAIATAALIVGLLITGILYLAVAGVIKVLIGIEENTRKGAWLLEGLLKQAQARSVTHKETNHVR